MKDVESLKMIVDLIGQLGGEAKSAFITWVVANYGSRIFTELMVAVSLFVIAKTIAKAFDKHSISDQIARAVYAKAQPGIRYYGVDSEIAEVQAWLNKQEPK